ncbi:hypothetical protein [Pseudohongiella sp.]|uniref:Uncharacterized protein n=1 Tax=marine sediment metagenome TaxID=412755 RepID=A0A0F9Y4M3_9ZZZZ|nr:hypothetical protein [Pseudohongiella sp.]HDZ10023.1 hypothetical protein [Pseudohongiella sp.]HEA63372.1 hypothetical protein [Pseudohongiella sp.]
MITFADSHVDLMGSVTFTPQELQRRWDRELQKKWRKEVQDNLRDFMQIKPSLDPETFPQYAQNDVLLSDFISDKQTCYQRRLADEVKNELLITTIAYEHAVRRKAELELMIDGRDAVAEVPEETDPETGEVTQTYVPPVTAVEPLATTIESVDESGDPVTITNPALTQALADLADAQAVIDDASGEVLTLAAERAL